MKISICIPTYNREPELEKLFQSLYLNNSLEKLEIIIVDDGSTDNSKVLIEKHIDENKLLIKYHYQENSGRGVALKKAVSLATGDYIMLMDSDDFFLADSIETILTTISNNKQHSGFIFLCLDTKNRIIGSEFPNNILTANLVELYSDYKVQGDKKEVVEAKYIKKWLYQNVFEERRVPTSLLWTNVSKDIDFLLLNKAIIVKDYLSDGMSKNLRKIQKQSPHGMYLLNKEKLFFPKYSSKTERGKSLLGTLYYGALTVYKYKKL